MLPAAYGSMPREHVGGTGDTGPDGKRPSHLPKCSCWETLAPWTWAQPLADSTEEPTVRVRDSTQLGYPKP